jgi:tRNA(adenine34) deaminase
MQNIEVHEKFLRHALTLARRALSQNEVPIGAVVVQNGEIIAEGFNQREKQQSAIGHAEIIAIQSACTKLGTWRLSDCDLYVTLEPCLMCAGALVQTRIRNVYFGAYDPKGGALGTLYTVHEDTRLNHRFQVRGGICAEECGTILSDFFKKKRKNL